MNEMESQPFCQDEFIERGPAARSPSRELRCFSKFSSKLRKKYSFSEIVTRGSYTVKKKSYSTSEKDWSDVSSNCGEGSANELLVRFERALSTLCFSHAEVTIIWDFIKQKKAMKCRSTKQEILEDLLEMISTSKAEKVIRASVSTLLLLISEDQTIIRYIKRKDLCLYNLASALKRNVHEAAILLYMLNPSPSEIRSLELLPALVEVACSYNCQQKELMLLPLTPTSASIAMIEVLVTAFDYVTNNMHLAAISSPQVLSKLVNVAMNNNVEEGVALAAILIRCMRLNDNCKKFLSQVTPLDPFLQLLGSNKKHARFAALEYFHEILTMPRSSAINMLHQIQQKGGISIRNSLLACIELTEAEQRLVAANILLQLDILEPINGKNASKEEAIKAVTAIVSTEKCTSAQSLAAHILSNLGGTHSWMGEPYTVPWLLKKAGLKSIKHRNMIKNVEWLDTCLQDSEISPWSVKAARRILKMGRSVFDALAKGIQSKNKSISHDCLVCIAWLGTELATMGANSLRYYACEVLLSDIAQFLHPGSDLDERILSCLCIYNYTSGKGKQKLVEFSEGIRESLRRLSGFTWMAEELLKVTDYFLPSKPRVSCVHTQILEIGPCKNGAATALIFYKGLLCVGHSDGSLKVWAIKEQRGMLLWELKEHKKAVTCFAHSATGDSILSGSSDKTVRVWKMVRRKLECVEVIDMKEPVQKMDSHDNKILVVTHNRILKVWHASNNVKILCKNKNVTSFVVASDKVYLGCSDSSIQEIDVMENNRTEIRTPAKSWRKQNKPINSLVLYKDWLYSAGGLVEGSSLKDWRRRRQPQISVPMKSSMVQAMEVVEDFIYLNCISSQNTIQIWLRGQQQKVGRISTSTKITSILTANDIIFCGTECGSIKAWIPL